MAVEWRTAFFSSACMLKIFRFLHRSLYLGPQKRLLKRTVLSCKIQGAAGGREGPQTTPGDFFSDHIGCQPVWFFSGFWKHLIYKGRAERLRRGISTVSSITRTWHLPFPPMSSLSFRWSLVNSAESLSIFSFFHYFCTYLLPPVLFASQLLSFAPSVASPSTPFHCHISVFI